MLVAEGAAEVMLESDLTVWDIAAPRLVVEEAGGRLSDLSGGPDLPANGVLAIERASSTTRLLAHPARRP